MSEIQKDLVLNPNEYAYVLDKTKGLVSCIVGPNKMSLSNSDALVTFDENTKKFVETTYSNAIKLFVTAPENWYITLKNPTKDMAYPKVGNVNSLVDLVVGKKVNVTGPTTFALYPGQMAKAIQGHRLRSNQYLLARVYDSDVVSTEDQKYTVGEILVIKGTDVSFYIPPTGIEVLAVNNGDKYIRDAVTLERLEYCILKDEDGNKRYVHGPAVVFPAPTEIFAEAPHRGYKFKAIELSKISGIYVKVIADYEEKGVRHSVGEELFITGNDQMIYYPRPEHAIIDYDGKFMHHAIAIPAGEGRYVLNRNTGEITTVKGPAMYLPDPRTEVVVTRKLTANQCRYWFPGNAEVLRYNTGIDENSYLERGMKSVALTNSYSSDDAFVETGFNRGTTYTKPRTITFDNKFDGVVTIDVWTGYAINVVSKTGSRKVILGPTTYLMDYDETIEVLELSTGRPKTTDNLLKTVYLRVDNNKISDLINVETKDFVKAEIKVSYCLDFLREDKEKWFTVENYIKYMTDRQRSLLKREVKKHTIEDFYANATDIVRKIVLNIQDTVSVDKPERNGRYFSENGMLVHDVEVLSVTVDRDVQAIIEEHQEEMVRKTLELSDAAQRMETTNRLCEIEKQENLLKQQTRLEVLQLQNDYELEKMIKDNNLARAREVEEKARNQAKADVQSIIDMVHAAELERAKKETALKLETAEAQRVLQEKEQQTYAETVKSIMESISPDLVAALTSKANADMLESVTGSMSPLAIANGESISDVTNKLLRGTSLEGIIGEFLKK